MALKNGAISSDSSFVKNLACTLQIEFQKGIWVLGLDSLDFVFELVSTYHGSLLIVSTFLFQFPDTTVGIDDTVHLEQGSTLNRWRSQEE